MKLQRTTVGHARIARLVLALFVLPVVAGCGDDGDESVASPASGATESTVATEGSVVDPASNVESLSYLMQGLLTTPEIGGGWVDMGRVVVPPSMEPQLGPLCPAGEALAEPIGTVLNAQVQTTYRRYDGTEITAPADSSAVAVNSSLVSGMVMETLLWNEREQVDEAFATWAAATDACVGEEWVDPDMGATVMTSFEAPTLGTASFTAGYAPVEPGSDPWLETQGITILLSDPSSPASIVITVSMTLVHDQPDQEVPPIDTDELVRIAEAAVARIEAGL